MNCANVKCDVEHDGSFGSGKFCSRKCANARSWSERDKQIKSLALKHQGWRPVKSFGDLNRIPEIKEKMDAKRLETLRLKKEKLKAERPFHQWPRDYVKELLLEEQGGFCKECGNGQTWNGKPLTLQLDHIDGNNENNLKENLRMLCPNCHTQTPTWGFKKRW